jgi:hypothetical protein
MNISITLHHGLPLPVVPQEKPELVAGKRLLFAAAFVGLSKARWDDNLNILCAQHENHARLPGHIG